MNMKKLILLPIPIALILIGCNAKPAYIQSYDQQCASKGLYLLTTINKKVICEPLKHVCKMHCSTMLDIGIEENNDISLSSNILKCFYKCMETKNYTKLN